MSDERTLRPDEDPERTFRTDRGVEWGAAELVDVASEEGQKLERMSDGSVRYAGDYEFSAWNLVGWFNDWRSTADQWITEILPLAIMIWIWPGA